MLTLSFTGTDQGPQNDKRFRLQSRILIDLMIIISVPAEWPHSLVLSCQNSDIFSIDLINNLRGDKDIIIRDNGV